MAMDGLVLQTFHAGAARARAGPDISGWTVWVWNRGSGDFQHREEQQRAGKEKFEVNFFHEALLPFWIPGANRGLRKSLAAKARECDSREVYAGTLDVQNAQRFAAIGISLRHSGHFLLVGSAGAAFFAARAFHAFIGATIKK